MTLFGLLLAIKLKNLIKVHLRNRFIVVAVVKVEGQLQQNCIVVKHLLEFGLVSLVVDSNCEIEDVLPLLSDCVAVPVC
jgi:hypothetical protein